jgi:predicted transcriptional regulator
MPVTKSTEYAKFNAVGLNQRPDSIQAQGRIRFLNDTITLIGDETTGVVNLLPLPKGALVDSHEVLLHLDCPLLV